VQGPQGPNAVKAGVVPSSSGAQGSGVWTINVSFTAPFTSTNYSVSVTPEGPLTSSAPYITNKTTTGFTIDVSGSDPGTSFDWLATPSTG
jgi:hypothetical protein